MQRLVMRLAMAVSVMSTAWTLVGPAGVAGETGAGKAPKAVIKTKFGFFPD